ncbi:MAG: hypothetical protein K0B11_17815 [Mariniphaga sp.]|nr:hypothetical protein [Mariniphaga sp.]
MKATQLNDILQSKFVFFLVVIAGLLASCSNDFLDTQYPTEYVAGDTIFVMSDVERFELEIDMQNSEPASWKLFQFPRWLEVNPKEGTVMPGSEVKFQFRIKETESGGGINQEPEQPALFPCRFTKCRYTEAQPHTAMYCFVGRRNYPCGWVFKRRNFNLFG